jgi:lauroyl/myristoyl acyltransferase
MWTGFAVALWRITGPRKAYRPILAAARAIKAMMHTFAPRLADQLDMPPLEYLIHRAMLAVSANGLIEFPVRIRNGKLLRRLHADHGAVVIASGHFGLPNAGCRAVEKLGLPLAAVQTRPDRANFWGAQHVLPIQTDAFALQKARTALRKGRVLLALVDTRPAKDTHRIKDHVFRMANKLAMPVLFFEGRLASNGRMTVEFSLPTPDIQSPHLDYKAMTEAFIAFITQKTNRRIVGPETT